MVIRSYSCSIRTNSSEDGSTNALKSLEKNVFHQSPSMIHQEQESSANRNLAKEIPADPIKMDTLQSLKKEDVRHSQSVIHQREAVSAFTDEEIYYPRLEISFLDGYGKYIAMIKDFPDVAHKFLLEISNHLPERDFLEVKYGVQEALIKTRGGFINGICEEGTYFKVSVGSSATAEAGTVGDFIVFLIDLAEHFVGVTASPGYGFDFFAKKSLPVEWPFSKCIAAGDVISYHIDDSEGSLAGFDSHNTDHSGEEDHADSVSSYSYWSEEDIDKRSFDSESVTSTVALAERANFPNFEEEIAIALGLVTQRQTDSDSVNSESKFEAEKHLEGILTDEHRQKLISRYEVDANISMKHLKSMAMVENFFVEGKRQIHPKFAYLRKICSTRGKVTTSCELLRMMTNRGDRNIIMGVFLEKEVYDRVHDTPAWRLDLVYQLFEKEWGPLPGNLCILCPGFEHSGIFCVRFPSIALRENVLRVSKLCIGCGKKCLIKAYPHPNLTCNLCGKDTHADFMCRNHASLARMNNAIYRIMLLSDYTESWTVHDYQRFLDNSKDSLTPEVFYILFTRLFN